MKRWVTIIATTLSIVVILGGVSILWINKYFIDRSRELAEFQNDIEQERNREDEIEASINLLENKSITLEKALGKVIDDYTSRIGDLESPFEWTVIDDIGINTETKEYYEAKSSRTVVMPIIPGSCVRVKKIQSLRCIMGYSASFPKVGEAVNKIKVFSGVENTDILLDSDENDRFMVLWFYNNSDKVDSKEIEDSLHFEITTDEIKEYDLIKHTDNNMINLLKYKPIGKVNKPYIALSCDDGVSALASYTLPRIQYWNNYYNTSIPLTMGLFDKCAALQDNDSINLITDMCKNSNCSIAIHGPNKFTDYSHAELYKFLKEQEDYIKEITGIIPTSILYPEHRYNDDIKTLCGSFYGVCGCGGNESPYPYFDNSKRPFYNGEKSNCYEIFRFNIIDKRIKSVDDIEDIIDYAYDNNLIIAPFFHDIDLDSKDKTEEELDRNRRLLDKIITYGMEKEVEFINIGDIPNLM